MHLTRLVYASTIASDFRPENIEDILRVSRANNAKNGVTGVLFFNSNYFLQCLEGDRQAVCGTYHRIAFDTRHEHPIILSCNEVAKRDFADWAMGYVPTNRITDAVNSHLIGEADFQPYSMSMAAAVQMVDALRDCLHTQ